MGFEPVITSVLALPTNKQLSHQVILVELQVCVCVCACVCVFAVGTPVGRRKRYSRQERDHLPLVAPHHSSPHHSPHPHSLPLPLPLPLPQPRPQPRPQPLPHPQPLPRPLGLLYVCACDDWEDSAMSV